MAPEVAVATPLAVKTGKYNSKADIWSLGITVIEMAETLPPFAGQNPIRAMKYVIILQYPYQIITCCGTFSLILPLRRYVILIHHVYYMIC